MQFKYSNIRVKATVIFLALYLTHCQQGVKGVTPNDYPEGSENSSSDAIEPYDHLIQLKDSLEHIDGLLDSETDTSRIAELEQVQEHFFKRFSEQTLAYKAEQDSLYADAITHRDSLIDNGARQTEINGTQIQVNIYSVTVDKAGKLVVYLNRHEALQIESSNATDPINESSEQVHDNTVSSSLIHASSSVTIVSSEQPVSSSQQALSRSVVLSSSVLSDISSSNNISSATVSSSSTSMSSSSVPLVNSEPVFNPAVTSHAIATVSDSAYSFDLVAVDSDGDSITWQVKKRGTATNGTVSFSTSVTSQNMITYTPHSGYSGTDSFVIEIVDGNGGASTMNIDVTISAPHTQNFALAFDGDNDYVDLPDVDLDFSKGVTIECWLRFATPRAYERIIEWGNGMTNDNVILLVDGANTKSLYFRVYHGTTGKSRILANNILTGVANTWTHIAMTLSSTGVAKFYKNGKEYTDVTGNPSAIPLSITRTKNFIGESNWANDPEFKGAMDEFRVWSTVRSLSEIAGSMDKRLTGSEQGLTHLWNFDDGTGTAVTDLVNAAQSGTTKNMSVGTEWIAR
ncbi:MAG: Ig-like domain-containing protein [Fibrobacterales bacterium]